MDNQSSPPPVRSYLKRSAARLCAVQALFQMEQTKMTSSDVSLEFLKYRIGQLIDEDKYVKADTTFFTKLVQGTSQEQKRIDEMLAGAMREDWTLERIESVVRAILRVGIFELMENLKTPAPIIINEYLDLTRAFYDDKEVSFVNGVLDRMAKLIRSNTK